MFAAERSPPHNPLATATRRIFGPRETRHLSAHGRRAVAARSVRSQAGARSTTTASLPGGFHPRQALRVSSADIPRFAASKFEFKPHGRSGAAIPNLLPNLAKVADEIAIVNSCTRTSSTTHPRSSFSTPVSAGSAVRASAHG
jgi:hypothetical protein